MAGLPGGGPNVSSLYLHIQILGLDGLIGSPACPSFGRLAVRFAPGPRNTFRRSGLDPNLPAGQWPDPVATRPTKPDQQYRSRSMETHAFQAETEKLLGLMIHSLYSKVLLALIKPFVSVKTQQHLPYWLLLLEVLAIILINGKTQLIILYLPTSLERQVQF